MAVSSQHPDYTDRLEEWQLMRRAKRGEQAIKESGVLYLPMPSGFATRPDRGVELYAAYQKRASFPNILSQTIAGMVGVIHRQEAKIEMPAALEPLWENASPDGLPLEALHRRITSELLLMGRYGLLVDFIPGREIPTIAGYQAETIINWDEDGSFFVLDETDYERSGYIWAEVNKWRVLELDEAGLYRQTLTRNDAANIGEPVEVRARGGSRLDFIPFVTIGARDLTIEPQDPPLLGVSRSAVNIYQLSADYRWQLFQTGQETLFILNAKAPEVVGAAVIVTLEGSDGTMPDAKYVGPAGTGIEAHRQAILDERAAAAQAGAKLFETSGGGSQESGEAKRIRFTAETATLTTIAQTSAQGLERALRYAAMMIGANPDEVTVTPNLEFVDQQLQPAEAEALVRVWQEGAISYETLYDNLQRGGIASQERTHEDELELIDEEEPERMPSPAEAGLIVTQQPSGDAAQQEMVGDAPQSNT